MWFHQNRSHEWSLSENQQLKPVRFHPIHMTPSYLCCLLCCLAIGLQLIIFKGFSAMWLRCWCVCACLRVCMSVCVCILFFEIYYRDFRKSLEQNSSNSQMFEYLPCSKLLCPGFFYLGKRSHRVSINQKMREISKEITSQGFVVSAIQGFFCERKSGWVEYHNNYCVIYYPGPSI